MLKQQQNSDCILANAKLKCSFALPPAYVLLASIALPPGSATAQAEV